MASNTIRVVLPFHLRNLAHVGNEVTIEVDGPITQRSVLDALEARYPMLRGAIRDHDTLQRRPFLRFFACEEDLSHESPDAPLPDAVASGKEPFIVIGAIAGGCRIVVCGGREARILSFALSNHGYSTRLRYGSAGENRRHRGGGGNQELPPRPPFPHTRTASTPSPKSGAAMRSQGFMNEASIV